MALFRNIVGVCAALTAMGIGAATWAASPAPAAGNGEFNGGKFLCLQYTNGLGENSSTKIQAHIAQLWMLGYLAGYYKAESKLEMSDDAVTARKVTDLMEAKCKESPNNSILVVASQALATEVHALPKSTADFAPGSYTCGQHVDARKGAASDANKADLAEMWAFAFIQGFKNVAAPGMEIDAQFKSALIGAINKSCASNPNMAFMDLTALVADKVKLQ